MLLKNFNFAFLLILAFSAKLTYAQQIGGVVNLYVAVSAVNVNSVSVNSTQGFAVGDRVLLIQMKGASISSGNNASFG